MLYTSKQPISCSIANNQNRAYTFLEVLFQNITAAKRKVRPAAAPKLSSTTSCILPARPSTNSCIVSSTDAAITQKISVLSPCINLGATHRLPNCTHRTSTLASTCSAAAMASVPKIKYSVKCAILRTVPCKNRI